MSAGMRESSGDLVGSALAVADATISLSLIGYQIQAATELQETELGRIGAAVAAVSQSTSELAEHASQSAAIASQSEHDAKEGLALVQEVSGDLEHAVGTATQSLELIEALGERVEQVGSIAASINKIASRTKLLALNAAIEAARAGEHGRGFSIVAEEVGALAQSTGEAASSIAEIVSAIQRTRDDSSSSSDAIRASTTRMAGAIDRAAQAGEAFTRIVSDVERLSALIAGVAATSAQQAEVAGDLDASARTITVAARSTVRSGQELGRAIGRVGETVDILGAATIASSDGAEARACATALHGIATNLTPFFELVRQQAGHFHAVYEEAVARRGGKMLREDLDALDAPIHAALRRFGDSILGTGAAPVRNLLEDAPLWVHWWFNGARGPEFPHYDFDPASPSYYDYPTMEWFHEPSTRLVPFAAGPYFDEGGMDEFLVTLTAPVPNDGKAIGVATADVRVDQIDRLCRPHLARLGRRAAIVNRSGRVVACTDHDWCAPGGDLDAELAQWCAAAGGPLTVEDRRTLAQTPTLPWALLIVD